MILPAINFHVDFSSPVRRGEIQEGAVQWQLHPSCFFRPEAEPARQLGVLAVPRSHIAVRNMAFFNDTLMGFWLHGIYHGIYNGSIWECLMGFWMFFFLKYFDGISKAIKIHPFQNIRVNWDGKWWGDVDATMSAVLAMSEIVATNGIQAHRIHVWYIC